MTQEFTETDLLALANAEGELTESELAQVAQLEDPDKPKEPQFSFDQECQDELLAVMLTVPEFAAEAVKLVKPDYFVNAEHRLIAKHAITYVHEHGGVPGQAVLRHLLLNDLREKPEDVRARYMGTMYRLLNYTPIGSASYYRKAITRFAQLALVRRAIREFVEVEKQGKNGIADFYTQIGQAIQVGTTADASKAYLIENLDSIPAVTWQIDQHVPAGGFGVIYGPFGSGKSFYTLDLALSVASGLPYLGQYEVAVGPVCYIAAEGGSGLAKRIRAWQHARLANDDAHFKNLERNFLLILETFDLVADATAPMRIAALCKQKLRRYGSITSAGRSIEFPFGPRA